MPAYPHLHAVSTVCLLKHYNQDYLLHSLRTDFTGSNGVGKSIIADLFQVVFIADTKHIKFATEGINKKKRRLETLPYQSSIGYVFFNVEVSNGSFITIGAAILAQGNNLVKPFIITSSISFESQELNKLTFTHDKLLLSQHFLKAGKEPYLLDELARIFPDQHQLYVHTFESREEKLVYYNWLYQKRLLPINLVKEGNLKAFAKVIQSFSKSKSLDIDSSKSLIEYLFEEDEEEITQEYKQQEQSISKLLHHFKTTKQQIADIESKQADLRELKTLDEQKQAAEHALDKATYIEVAQKHHNKQATFTKTDREIKQKTTKLQHLQPRSKKFKWIVDIAQNAFDKADKSHEDLAKSQALFQNMETLQHKLDLLLDINIDGLVAEVPNEDTDLLDKDDRYYTDHILKSKQVLKRYASLSAIEEQKRKQDSQVKEKIKTIEEREGNLDQFLQVLKETSNNSLFVQTLAQNKPLTEAQLATLVHLRQVTLNRPSQLSGGARYTETKELIHQLEIVVDPEKGGWWLKTGLLKEYIPKTSLLLPDFTTTSLTTVDELQKYLQQQLDALKEEKKLYEGLLNGIVPKDFSTFIFDPDLSDNTKIAAHKTAAYLCGLLDEKIGLIRNQLRKETEKITSVKKQYGIADTALEYQTLLNNLSTRKDYLRKRFTKLSDAYTREQKDIETINSNLPLLQEQHKTQREELEAIEKELVQTKAHYQTTYPEDNLPDDIFVETGLETLREAYKNASGKYISWYNQIISKYEETKENRHIAVNDQVNQQRYGFTELEQALLGNRIKTLDGVTEHLEQLTTDLLSIADELMKGITNVFKKTEENYDKYRKLVGKLNDFFRGKLISDRFYFQIDFNPAPKLDINWIEHLRKSVQNIASKTTDIDISPQEFIESFYLTYSGNKSRVSVEQLLNPKSYFELKGRLTDENGKDIPGSTGESYTAIALLGIARLSVVQDGDRPGLRFLILEESATLDNVNFGMFPRIAKDYGYQIITMTPKPYAVGNDEGWYLHQLIPGTVNKDINYPKVMSYFRTNKEQVELSAYLKNR